MTLYPKALIFTLLFSPANQKLYFLLMQRSKSDTKIATATFPAQRNTTIISTLIVLHLKKLSKPSSLKISIPAFGSQFTSPENTLHWFSFVYSDPAQHILLKPARESPSAHGIFLLKSPWLLAHRIKTKIFDSTYKAWHGLGPS